MSTNGASTEKEDTKGDKSAAVEKAVEPEATKSNSKPESAKSPPVSPVKNREDGSTDETDKKQSGTNDISPRATESIRYIFCFVVYMKYAHLFLEDKNLSLVCKYLVYSKYQFFLVSYRFRLDPLLVLSLLNMLLI